jgi:hypothetical protein
MLTPVVQRWRDRRSSYRPAGETIDRSRYEVAPIPDDTTARRFILEHHYSGSYPNARFRFGLYWSELLVGVAVFSHPVNDCIFDVFGGDRRECLELGRLVLLDAAPANAESFFIAQCFGLLRLQGIRGVVSFSDPVRRTTADGRLVLAGHVGTIYQATNAVYTGTSKGRNRLLLPDGTLLHERALAKIRARDSRWESAAKPLILAGAKPLLAHEDAAAWVKRWAARLCRPLHHSGNHRYLFGLDRQMKKHLPPSLPYPKFCPDALPLAA